jgi:pentalenene oxygenase
MDTTIDVAVAPRPAPVAPGRLPLLGHAVQLARRPLAFMDGLRQYGKVVRIQLGPAPAYVVTDPEITRTVLVTEPKSFVKGGQIIEALRVFFGDGLATVAEGDLHRRNRRLMQPMFNRVHVAARADAMIGLVEARTRAWPEGTARAIHDEMNDLTLGAFLVALFGTDLPDAVGREFPRLLPEIMRGTIRQTVLPGWLARLPLPAQRRYRANLVRLRELVDETIDHDLRRQQEQKESPGLFRTLTTARDPETGEGLSRRQLRDEVITLLTGSVETTGTTLAWALYEIARNPEIERRLHEEIDAVCADRPLRAEDLPTLDYTRRLLQETMRCYGPAWLVTRRTTDAVTLGGYHIPRDTDVVYSPYILQHDPEAFPDPNRFDPDRWEPGRAGGIPRGSFLAFGAGNRQCIGESFAWTELVIILAVVASQWRMIAASDRTAKPVAHVTVHPDKLYMTPRGR